MTRQIIRGLCVLTVSAATVLLMTGCGNMNSLPSTVVVELPDGTTITVEQGAGVPSLADSSWDFTQTSPAGQSITFVRVTFGPDGELQRFDNSTLASNVFGDAIIFDGQRRPTAEAGFEYAATTFGAATEDGTGFTFQAVMTAFFSGLLVGEANITATGTFDPDDSDVMSGMFSFTTELTIPIQIEGANISQEFAFSAQRVVE